MKSKSYKMLLTFLYIIILEIAVFLAYNISKNANAIIMFVIFIVLIIIPDLFILVLLKIFKISAEKVYFETNYTLSNKTLSVALKENDKYEKITNEVFRYTETYELNKYNKTSRFVIIDVDTLIKENISCKIYLKKISNFLKDEIKRIQKGYCVVNYIIILSNDDFLLENLNNNLYIKSGYGIRTEENGSAIIPCMVNFLNNYVLFEEADAYPLFYEKVKKDFIKELEIIINNL